MIQATDPTPPTGQPKGFRSFTFISIGQIISILGTGLTNFAISLWVLQRTGSVTNFALLLLIVMLPGLLFTPIAGAVADRVNRRRVMILSDVGSALASLVLVLLFYSGDPSIWLIACALGLSSVCGAFHAPAYIASVSQLVPKDQLGRANGIVQIGEGLGKIITPVVAGVLLMSIGVVGVILIDLFTFLVAMALLLPARIPDVTPDAEAAPGKTPIWQQATAGWKYVKARPGLLALLLFFTFISFVMGMAEVLVPPMLLASASPAVVGTVVSIFGSGLLVGSIVMSTWSGPKRRIYGVFLFALVHALALAVAGLRPSIVVITVGLFLWTFSIPLVNGCMRVIYQLKTPTNMQGRVFATASVFVQVAMPLAVVISGPLADYVFEPLLSEGGALAGSVGQVIGTGKGRGIALMLILMGLAVLVGTLVGYLYPRLRQVETELPDAVDESQTGEASKVTAAEALPEMPVSAADVPATYLSHEAQLGTAAAEAAAEAEPA